MKKVLLIAYYFPPDPAIGAFRAYGLAKYLPDFGWEPLVLTVKRHQATVEHTRITPTDYRDVGSVWKQRLGLNNDSTIKKQLLDAPDTKLQRGIFDTLMGYAGSIVYYPDRQKGWRDFAVKAAKNIIEEEGVDGIISTSEPVTSHIIARRLKTECGTPWIADLRDLWTQNHYYPHNAARRFLERQLEKRTLSDADALVTVSENLSQKLETLHSRSTYTVTNGFDPSDIPSAPPALSGKFRIVYAGTLYAGRRDPTRLFKPLSELISEGVVDISDVEICFYGPKADWMRRDAQAHGLGDVVMELGSVSRTESLAKQREAQLLLLLLWDHPEEVGVYTGKVFEYLASRRPILACGGRGGVVEELLNDTQAGVYASSDEVAKDALIRLYLEYKASGRVSYRGDTEKVGKYSQVEMARKFATVLDQVSRNRNASSGPSLPL